MDTDKPQILNRNCVTRMHPEETLGDLESIQGVTTEESEISACEIVDLVREVRQENRCVRINGENW